MPSNADSPQRPPLWPLIVAALLLALLPRAAIIFASRADLFGPPAGALANISLGEELTRGDVAMELVQGPLLSLTDYQYAHFFGGATVCGIFAAPLFAVFGAKLWALKLAACMFHLVALCFGIALVDRWVSRRGAQFFGLLFALSPPGYSLLTTVAWGSHVESAMFAMVCFWLFLDLRDIGPQADGRALRRFALGACTGFAIWFNYSCLLFLAVLLLFDALFDRRIWRAREFSVQLAGVLVGALPWLFYNVRNDWAGLSIYGTSLVDHVASGDGHADSLARLFDLSARALPGAFFFRDFAGVERGIWDALSCSVLFGLALAPWFLTRRPRPVPYLMAWTYLAVFTLAYSLSDFEVGKPEDDIRGWRYVMLPIPFLTLAAACGLDAIAKRSNTFLRVAWLIAVVWAGSSFLGTTGFVDGTRAFADLQREGSSQAHFGRWMALRYAKEPAVLGRLCSRAVELRSEADQAAFFGGMANALRNFSIKQPSMTPKELARAEDYRVAMDWLSQNAPDTYRSFFQVAEPLK